jgi:hypothetical protein
MYNDKAAALRTPRRPLLPLGNGLRCSGLYAAEDGNSGEILIVKVTSIIPE